MAAMHPVDYYSTITKNCSGFFTEEEVKRIRAFYYAMCAEADAMLGKWTEENMLCKVWDLEEQNTITLNSIFIFRHKGSLKLKPNSQRE